MTQLTVIRNKAHLPWAIYHTIFNGVRFVYKGKELRPVMVHTNNGTRLKKVQVGEFIYIEQNPGKLSEWGELARNGKKILWIIHQPTGVYVGRIVEGNIVQLQTAEQLQQLTKK